MLDYLNNKNSNLKAIGMCIFSGSATIGTMKAGYNVDRILEITDKIVEQNAKQFINNFNIPVIIPSIWENDDYLKTLKDNHYDLLFANPPCSGLSQINRHASANNETNIHIYRTMTAIDKIEPRAFIIENAPTLIKLGFPIIQELITRLGDKYRFTIIRDMAGSHNVAMKRMRTMIVGWNKQEFNKIPLLHMNKQPLFTTKDAIGDLYDKPLNSIANHECPIDGQQFRTWNKYSNLLSYVNSGNTLLMSMVEKYNSINLLLDDTLKKKVNKAIKKLNNNERLFDKSPYRVNENNVSPSLTSVAIYIHPTLNRLYTIREYARLMGYPDDFKFVKCKVPLIQCIAQGVPAKFMEYITSEIINVFNGNREFLDNSENATINFEHHNKECYELFTKEQIKNMTNLEATKNSKKMIY